MRPSIYFHQVASIGLSPIREFPKNDDDEAFAARDLIVTDAKGQRFEITLYAPTAAALMIPTLTEPRLIAVHDPVPAAPVWSEEDAS